MVADGRGGWDNKLRTYILNGKHKEEWKGEYKLEMMALNSHRTPPLKYLNQQVFIP